MTIYLTGNQQFGRKGAIRAYKRPFDSVDEMNQHLIEQWNSTVSDEDIVFVLGNFAWDPETAEVIIKQLNGTIIILQGEYDKAIEDIVQNPELNITYLTEGIKLAPEVMMCLSYWPLEEWPGKKEGFASIIGHPSKSYPTSHQNNRINVACDFWNYKPVNAKSVLELFGELKG